MEVGNIYIENAVKITAFNNPSSSSQINFFSEKETKLSVKQFRVNYITNRGQISAIWRCGI